MKVSGEAVLQAPVQRVYEALTDPAVLVRTIPGCERLERVGPDAYTAVVSAGVASIKGRYAGEVVLTDRQPPHEFVLKASGAGAPGTVSAEAKVRLADGEGGTTTLTYDADAVIGGMVGGVGQRILTAAARRTADEFFAAVNGVLTGSTPDEAPAVFTRPAAAAGTAGDFTRGVALGAAAALLGVIVGGLLGRRRRG
ncbi:MAG TPA: carbon monoxide dehydrogenase subunit G [Micromonosporaceae bacterium]|nr:carbon monoxide dehydrogenase subunit G [Micromonosporaceae bacterium]